jgi:hypothetical protein
MIHNKSKTKICVLLFVLSLLVLNTEISKSVAFELPNANNCKGSRVPTGTNSFSLDPASQSRVNRLIRTKGCVPAGTKLNVIGKVRARGQLNYDSLVLSISPFNFRESGTSIASKIPSIDLDNGTYRYELSTPKNTGPTGLNEPQGISSAIYDENLGFNTTPDGFTSYCNMKNVSRIRFRACVSR